MKKMIKIAILGDYMPVGRPLQCLKNKDFNFLNGIKNLIEDADFKIVNLEAPVCDDLSRKINKTGPNLKIPKYGLDGLENLSIDLVTLSNNHMMDYGAEGLKQTLEACEEYGITTIGAGKEGEDKSFYKIINLKGKKFGIINVCENEWSTIKRKNYACNPLDEISLYQQIKQIKREANYIIVIIHGGHEGCELPSPRMVKLYRWLIDLGADAVIGHHTHCFSGTEIYKNKPIVYSLGNFVFDIGSNSGLWNIGVCAILSFIEEEISIKLIPFKQFSETSTIKLLEGNEYDDWHQKKQYISNLLKSPERLNVEFKKEFDKMGNNLLNHLEPYKNRIFRYLRSRKFFPSLYSNRQKMMLLNMLRCESHRDALIQKLLKDIK